jgi:hypothetical protein
VTPYRRVVPVHRTPAAEVDVSVEVVRRLLAGQHPDLVFLSFSADNPLMAEVGQRTLTELLA